jgi:hypothetical protein
MTESEAEQKPVAVITTEATPATEKIPERNTIVYQTRIEPHIIETISEKTKTQLFTKLALLKPKPEDVQLVSIDKYYEPYLTITAKYHIDYYRKTTYTIKIDNKVHEIIISNQKYKPIQPKNPNTPKDNNLLKLQAEERLTTNNKASLTLNKYGQEVTPNELTPTTPEQNPSEILTTFETKEIPQDTDLNIIRAKILKRPKNINKIITELFEVNERAIIYTPRYRVLYTNLKTGEMKAIEFDGITAQRIQHPHPQFPQKPT